MKKWVCKVCGYIYEGPEAPAECPVCHAKSNMFEEVKGEMKLAAEHEFGVYAKTVKNNDQISEEDKKYIFDQLMANFNGECSEVGMYLCMARIAHRECSGGREELGVTYQTVSTISDPLAPIETIYEQLRAHQSSHAAAERASRMCLSGPHKDDIAVMIGGVNARQFSSQGQTRTAALAFKLAEREIYREITSRTPLLLLDDVLSELDPKRQEYVLNRISGGQVFITCCEEDRLETLLGGKVLHVENGKVV